ncbi:MAG: aquaporin [Acidobacteriia bacterium]|nr:aquaporin [Terriglobia bacterium]
MYTLPQKLFAELIGTCGVVFVATGAICADQYQRAAGSAPLGPLGCALAYGLAVALMTSAFAHISGAHLNPAITVAQWVSRRMGTWTGLCYCAAQLAGALAGAALLAAILPDTLWRPVGLGTPNLTTDFTRAHGMLLEGVLTFVVVLVAFAKPMDARGLSHQVAAFAIGLTVAACSLVGVPFTGAAMNPARVFGPALVAHHWQNHGVYWLGPLFGACLAGVLHDRLYLRERPAAL